MKINRLVLICTTLISYVISSHSKSTIEQKTDIVWIKLKDWGYQLSCCGKPEIHAPNIEKFALEGIRYSNSFCITPVWSLSRAAIITGNM